MINLLKDANRLHSTVILISMTLFCFTLSALRYYVTGTRTYHFLNWNLFLAFIPWFISSVIVLYRVNNKSALFVLAFSWLLFFPNSPYILTDLFHLHKGTAAPMWFDLVLILSFAWTGLLYGFSSLLDMERIFTPYIKKIVIGIITSVFLFLSCFGVYLGRYLRWNSWDIIANPIALFYDIGDRFLHPFQHSRTWGMTLFLGILLNMMYFSFRSFVNDRHGISKEAVQIS